MVDCDEKPWAQPVSPPEVVPEVVQVWRLPAGAGGQLLTVDEAARAGRMREGPGREEFVAGRSLLRRLLGHHLGCEPLAVPLVFGPQGKPGLPPGLLPGLFPGMFPGMGDLAFNVAHSGGLVLVALGRGTALGVDLEFRNPSLPAEEALELARTTFSAEELRAIERTAAAGRVDAFFDTWAMKEAVVKAEGGGLSLAVQEFSVGYREGNEQWIGLGEKVFWVRRLEVSRMHAAALACGESGFAINYFDGRAIVTR